MTRTQATQAANCSAGKPTSRKMCQLLCRRELVLYHIVQHSDILKQIFTKQINALTSRFSFLSELHITLSCPQVENSTVKRDHSFQVFEILNLLETKQNLLEHF